MRRSTGCEPLHVFGHLPFAAALGASVALAALAVSSAAATSPTATPCPSVAVVDAALGQKALKAPATTLFPPYAKTCTYDGYSDGGAPNSTMTVGFQEDTAASFAAGEKAASSFGGKVYTVHGLGVAAWTTNLGSLYVFNGHESIKILALLTPTSKLEVLARKLL